MKRSYESGQFTEEFLWDAIWNRPQQQVAPLIDELHRLARKSVSSRLELIGGAKGRLRQVGFYHDETE